MGKSKYSLKICPKFHFTLTVISLESVRNAFSADVCEWFLVLDWIIHQRVRWEQNIRYIYLPSLKLSIIMWLSHLLTSFSSQRNRYLFPKYRVAHIWAERFRYGYTPSVVMVSVHASSPKFCRFELQSGHTKDYEIGICCFTAKYAALRGRSKDWLARNQNNVSEWSDMSVHGLLFWWASTIRVQLSVLV